MNPQESHTAEPSIARGGRRNMAWVSAIMLTVITLLAFANAAHDVLLFDDRAFVGEHRSIEHDSLSDVFTTDLWDNASFKGFYRPLLLLNFELENRVFADWPRGFHLVNIASHLAACLLLLGLLRCLLQRRGAQGRIMEMAALIAALVFAVHPIHTEAVNSVFNRSSIYVAICATAGLWWLFSRLESRPASAWLGLGLAYSVGILIKESALVIPGLAVALIVILTPGGPWERIRRFLPVFWLLIPLAVYFYLRFNALAPPSAEGNYAQMLEATRLPVGETLLKALASAGRALELMVWPWPLKLFHEAPTGVHMIALVAGQAALAVAAIVLFFRGRPALAAGLSFFYIAYLPASRLISTDGAMPHLAERYLYFPSVGLAITLAFAVYALIGRIGRRKVAALCLPVILLLAAVTWDRNHDWSNELTLFETEFQGGRRGPDMMRILGAALIQNEQYARMAEICDESEDDWPPTGRFSNSCATAYMRLNRVDDAVRALEFSARAEDTWRAGRLALGNLLIGLGRKQEGADQYSYVINHSDNPAHKELYKGVLYVKLYPGSSEKLAEARAFFKRALVLDPEFKEARDWIDRLDAESAAASGAEPE